MNLSAYSRKHTASLYHCLASSNTENSKGAQVKKERHRPSGERRGSRQKRNEHLYMQMILNCQELRILMRIKHEREVSIQKRGKKTPNHFCT